MLELPARTMARISGECGLGGEKKLLRRAKNFRHGGFCRAALGSLECVLCVPVDGRAGRRSTDRVRGYFARDALGSQRCSGRGIGYLSRFLTKSNRKLGELPSKVCFTLGKSGPVTKSSSQARARCAREPDWWQMLPACTKRCTDTQV